MPKGMQPTRKIFGFLNEMRSVPKMTRMITIAKLKLSSFTEEMTSERMNCDEKVRSFSPSKFQCP